MCTACLHLPILWNDYLNKFSQHPLLYITTPPQKKEKKAVLVIRTLRIYSLNNFQMYCIAALHCSHVGNALKRCLGNKTDNERWLGTAVFASAEGCPTVKGLGASTQSRSPLCCCSWDAGFLLRLLLGWESQTQSSRMSPKFLIGWFILTIFPILLVLCACPR